MNTDLFETNIKLTSAFLTDVVKKDNESTDICDDDLKLNDDNTILWILFKNIQNHKLSINLIKKI